MSIPKSIFREYDIRGLVESELTLEVMRLLGRSCAVYFHQHNVDTALVGRDNRLSSPVLRDALIEGLLATGVNVTDIGTVITPAFYFACHHLQVRAGVMITASHNPSEFNGMKVALGPGTIYGAEIQKIGEIAEALLNEKSEVSAIAAAHAGKSTAVSSVDIRKPYLDMLREKLRLGERRLKVCVDCGNGTASLFAVDFLRSLGCEVFPLYCESDGRFPNHHPDPTQRANVVDLQAEVAKRRADVGLGYDGDGDRLGVVDDQGSVVWGDQLMVLFWEEILAKHPGAEAIIEVKCSQALVDEVRRMGGRPLFYRTGHSLIKAKMREIGALFTGEMSGHMFFADEFYGFDDALYASGRLLRILSHTKQPLSELLSRQPHYYSTGETRVPCADEAKFAVVADLTRRFQQTHEVIDVDGARVLFEEGWGLVRASNTQPAIVARCEGKTAEALEQIKATMGEALRRYPEVGSFTWAE